MDEPNKPGNQGAAPQSGPTPTSGQSSTAPEVANPPVGAEITPVTPAPAPEIAIPPAEDEEPAGEPGGTSGGPEPAVSQPAPMVTASAAQRAHGSSKPIGAILAAVIIAVLLAGLSIYAFLKTRQTSRPAAGNTSQNSQSAATAGDADQTSRQLDESIDKAEAQDIDGDISDPALGL